MGLWPDKHLEKLVSCPVCGEAERRLMLSNLTDKVFNVAPGTWQLWRCLKCESAFLDPRPTVDSIGLAYANYYTHDASSHTKRDYASLGPIAKLRRQITNGYTRWRFSGQERPASALGVLIAFLFPRKRKQINYQYRYLPPFPDKGGTLLDIGCGNGSFMARAKMCGWEVVGLEPDSEAAAVASDTGLTVHEAGVEYYNGQGKLFDVIMLSHVLEHVHEPVELLAACHRLLRPGGLLYLETPNINSFGYDRFGMNWRGLEPPRHLVLFNRKSVSAAMRRVGFSSIKSISLTGVNRNMYVKSYAMEQGLSPYVPPTLPSSLAWQARLDSLRVLLCSHKSEFLFLIAKKPV